MLMHTPGAVPGETDVSREGVVVVIDDDASVRAGLKELFESVGLNVKLYPSGSDFLEDGISDATSCLVLDVRLPETSGLKVQEELARAGLQVPLIFITEHGSIATAVQAMKAGAVDFLTKPISSHDLLDAVFTALEQDRTRRETGDPYPSPLLAGFREVHHATPVPPLRRFRVVGSWYTMAPKHSRPWSYSA